MLKFLRNWTLPIAMLIGTLAYLIFAKWSFLAPVKPFVHSFVSFITPWLIFAQLLLTFCKIDLKELKPKRWHLWLLIIQVVEDKVRKDCHIENSDRVIVVISSFLGNE